MSETKTWNGGCHCGAVRYRVELALDRVITCNCSHCSAKGLLLSFVTEDRFTLLSGEDELGEYRFNKHRIQHLFCRKCGVQSFARGKRPDGTANVAINVRCLEGVDLGALSLTPFDGRSI